MAQMIVGVFPNRQSAEDAIVGLKDGGFDPTRIGFITRKTGEERQMAKDVGLDVGTGAITGGVLGGGLGAIMAATGAFVIPGVGPFIAAGILTTAIAGGAAGALVGGLVGLGVPHEEAEYYHRRVVQGASLVTVDAADREQEARDILLRNGAEDTWNTTPWQSPAEGSQRQTAAPVDRGSIVGPEDAVQHAGETNPFAGNLAPNSQSEGTMNYDAPDLGQPEPPLDAGSLPPGRK